MLSGLFSIAKHWSRKKKNTAEAVLYMRTSILTVQWRSEWCFQVMCCLVDQLLHLLEGVGNRAASHAEQCEWEALMYPPGRTAFKCVPLSGECSCLMSVGHSVVQRALPRVYNPLWWDPHVAIAIMSHSCNSPCRFSKFPTLSQNTGQNLR